MNCSMKSIKRIFLLVPVRPVSAFLTSTFPLLFSIEYFIMHKKANYLEACIFLSLTTPQIPVLEDYCTFSWRGKQGAYEGLSCAHCFSIQPWKPPRRLFRSHSAPHRHILSMLPQRCLCLLLSHHAPYTWCSPPIPPSAKVAVFCTLILPYQEWASEEMENKLFATFWFNSRNKKHLLNTCNLCSRLLVKY